MEQDRELLTEAETSLIGSVLIRGRDVLEEVNIKPADFSSLKHELAWKLFLSMHHAGQQIDLVTANAALQSADDTTRRNVSPVWLHETMAGTPTAANASYYADIVTTGATRRKLTAAATRIAQAAVDMPPADLIDFARAEIDQAADITVNGLQPMSEHVAETIEDMKTTPTFKPTPWQSLNDVIGGFRPGAMYVVGARPGAGKALALDTPLPTPSGWTTMGEVQVGDFVLGMDGKPARVSFATGIQLNRKCYEVEFSNGEVIVADAEHLWLTETRAARRAATPPGGYKFNRSSSLSQDQRWKNEKESVKTTTQIVQSLRVGSDDRLNHSVRLAAPLALSEKQLPVDPYIFGYWLGDGSKHHAIVTVGDQDLEHFTAQVESVGYHWSKKKYAADSAWTVRVSTRPIRKGGVAGDSLNTRLREMGVLENKHIPISYLRASVAQRRALLAGILDSDGTVSDRGNIACSLCDPVLAEGVAELARSLGYRVSVSLKTVKGRTPESSVCRTIAFSASDNPFRMERKRARVKPRTVRAERIFITDVREVESVPVKCIQVENDDHMYLAGKAMIPTHNTIVGLQAALEMTKHGAVLFATLEMGRAEMHKRVFAQQALIPLERLVNSDLTSEEWAKLDALNHGSWSRLYIEDSSTQTAESIRMRARTIARQQPLACVVVDYLQLMEGTGGQGVKRQELVAQWSRKLKLMAKSLNVPVIALSQLNRESDRGEPPKLSDLRESGAIEQDADVVMLMQRDDKLGELKMLVAKNRHGPRMSLSLNWWGGYSMLTDPWVRTPAQLGTA